MPEDMHWQQYARRFQTFPVQIDEVRNPPAFIVCIPVMAEPDLIVTLDSIWSCERLQVMVEVILLFNTNEKLTADELYLHDQSWLACKQWVEAHAEPEFQFRPVFVHDMPDLRGGVGWARKLSMDEAARRLEQEGIILCLDADCLVEKNYLRTVFDYFVEHPSCEAASIYFEHRLDHLEEETRHAIISYELHLRYLVQAMRWAGHPYSFHTVGSAMAVRRSAYLAQGGMNKRQAGEDFYFLQKFIELGMLQEIRGTTVYPSARISSRVPFGTGKAMQSLLIDHAPWKTTDFEIFRIIKPLFQHVDSIRDMVQEAESKSPYDRLQKVIGLHSGVVQFLQEIEFVHRCRSIEQHTSSLLNFRKRFFRYFNAFMMIRYAHYVRDHFFPDVDVMDGAEKLCRVLDIDVHSGSTEEELLNIYRQMDKL